MYAGIKQFGALTLNTVRMLIRQPLILLMTTLCLALTGLLPTGVMFNLGEEGKLVRDGALAFHFVFGLLIASAAASTALYREIKSGTAATVLCKPVRRWLFFLSTFCGVMLTLVLFSIMALIATLFAIRMALVKWKVEWMASALFFSALFSAYGFATLINFRLKRPFTASAFLFMIPALLLAFAVQACLTPMGHLCQFGSLIQWRVVPASILITMAILTLAAIAVSLSTRLTPLLTFVLCAGIFFIGLISDYLFGQVQELSHFAAALYRLLPDWQDFWMTDALTGGGIIPWPYVGLAAAYAALYTAGVLGLGLLSFRNVEIR